MKTIYMIGDSIMQTNKYATYPQTGWGQVLNLFVRDDVNVINLAKNGTSSKSFLSLKLFDPVIKNIKEGDLLIVGFGHNDEKSYDLERFTEPFTSFKNNLRYFYDIANEKKAKVIFTTPVIRRQYKDGLLVDTHGDYVQAIKEVAVELHIPYIDLNSLTTDFYNKIGEEKSRAYFMNFDRNIYENFPNGSSDNSHQRYKGAVQIAKLFVEEVFRQELEEIEYFLELPYPISCAASTYES